MRRARGRVHVIVIVGVALFFAAAPLVLFSAASAVLTVHAAGAGAEATVYESSGAEFAAYESGGAEAPVDGSGPVVTEAPVTDGTIGDGTDATEVIDVSGIEIGDYKEVMSVGETQEISVTVLPQNATEQTVSYESSDEDVVTVNSKGTVKGVSAGKALVTISAGGVTKRVSIKVREATEYLDVDVEYLVMKIGETRAVRAKALPKGASQDITYKSLNPKVAKVTKTGVIRARSMGSTSIFVSNDEMSVGITVIVGKVSAAPDAGGKGDAEEQGGEGDAEGAGAEEAAFISAIRSSGEATVSALDCPALTAEMLSALYAAGAKVEIRGAGYAIRLSGGDIVNTGNELATSVAFVRNAEGVEFLLNRGRNLPGRIELVLTDRDIQKKYVYLYNDAKKRYELLDAKDGASLLLDVGGKYLMTDEKRGGFGIDPFVAGVAASTIGAAIVVFVLLKRRYWFW